MQYRNFGNLDWKASALGFGCMRLPTVDGKPASAIDEAEATRMVRHAIDSGVNYIDTAYVYHGGESENFLGRALKDGYREKIRLATKLPVWEVNGPEDFDRLLDAQLAKLQTDHIDFYLLHALDKNRWRNTVVKHNLLAKAEAALADGRIRHLGFSMHDDFACLEEILNGSSLFDFCQIQYNYMDIENQAGTRGLKLAASKGLAVVIMEPLLGGRLATPPNDIRAEMEAFPIQRTPVDWALQWLWDQPEVSVVLSGMSTFEQVEQNLQSADQASVGSFGSEAQALIASARAKYQSRTAVPCTKCGYCMPCPAGVNIPGNFDIFNFAHLYENLPDAQQRYQIFFPEPQRANHCVACGACEEVCPQSIPISEWMPKVAELLA
jgi:predicted aldo/keto reductase-like oxidoreductase